MTTLGLPGPHHAAAQVVVNQSGANGPNGANVFGDADGDNGFPGKNATFSNSNAQTTVGSAVVGTANGGRGGDGGSVVQITIIPPEVKIDGGNGGNGGAGGTVDATNTAVLNTTGNNGTGIVAEANGGNGGDGAFAFSLFGTDGGVGGTGGAGGTATVTTTATSQVMTLGFLANGITANASGGNGGDGGFGGAIGSGEGGNGGNGGSGGSASAVNAGGISTQGAFAKGMLVRSAGGVGGDGADGFGIVSGGGNGGIPTLGGPANGQNSGTIVTRGDYASGMVVQSVGGGGGSGGGAFGVFSGGGAGANGNNGGSATGTNTGNITTNGLAAIGMLVESVGGGGGDGGGAIGSVALGGKAAGGGNGGNVVANVGGTIRTGADGSGDGAHGVLAQSVGGGGGNGGFAVGVGPVAAVGIGGGGGTGGNGGTAAVGQAFAGGFVETNGRSAIGVLAQSVGGGGGNGGGAYTINPGVAVSIGGDGNAGGNGGTVTYNVSDLSVTTRGADSAGILAQSVGGGGGNGGYSLAVSGLVSVGVGGAGAAGGTGGAVAVTSGGSVETFAARSAGILAQSIGGGGGNGGSTLDVGTGVNIGIGGKSSVGGSAGTVDVVNAAAITTHGVQSHGIFAQSVGGGGGSGGYAIAAGLGPAVSIGGSGNGGGTSQKVTVENSGAIVTEGDLSVGILGQSIGGGGGDGGFSFSGGTTVGVSVGGSGGGGNNGGVVEITNDANIATSGGLAHGILAQSIGGGGGNGGSAGSVAVGLAAVSVSVGGFAGAGRDGNTVAVDHSGNISVAGAGAKAILAQSIGGGGGNGGDATSVAIAGNYYPYPAGSLSVAVGGKGGNGGAAGNVTVDADGIIAADTGSEASGGVVAQSIGGGGGNGGRSTTLSGSVSPTVSINLGVSVGGAGGAGGTAGTVRVNTGLATASEIRTTGNNAAGILAQSIGGGGGTGGDSFAGAGGFGGSVTVSAVVGVGGKGGTGNTSGAVHVVNAATVKTSGDMSNAILAQSIGGSGGSGGSSSGNTGSINTGSGVNVTAAVSIGASGGSGNHGNTVEVRNSGKLTTTGDMSAGIVAQSIGGGGGIGGDSSAKAYTVGSGDGTNINANVSVGGKGGAGSDGRKVTVDNSGAIATSGYASSGITALSVGGGGGAAGAAAAADEAVLGGGSATVSLGAAVGGGGAAAGDGGEISLTNRALIVTDGEDSYGISASSIGGGGGFGGAASAGADADYAFGGAVGGIGGAAGSGKLVEVINTASAGVWTKQDRSVGIFAQSVGGGGGVGGAGASTGSSGDTVEVKFAMGGIGSSGGNGGQVRITNDGFVLTDGTNAHGIMAQSVGGGGGNGGASAASAGGADVAVALSLSGTGGKGGFGDFVQVTNGAGGNVVTNGNNAYGIFAQSVGGGGGTAGAGSTETGDGELGVSLTIGGLGGSGNRGGNVAVDNAGQIVTAGALSHGIFAQSVGGGGGASGVASSTSKADMKIGGQVALPAGDGANGGVVTVDNSGRIDTTGNGALGIFAQSVGGGGGFGGVVSDEASGDNSYGLQLGGFGGRGGDGGDVSVDVSGTIVTRGERAHGVVAQSVGGGGGYGGDANGKAGVSLGIGGLGGNGGDGGDVSVIRSGTILTTGKDSIAIIAQSVGGGGGIGGAGFGRFGADDDGNGPNAIGFNTPGGSKGTGGRVTVVQTGAIETMGDRAHGVVLQAVGGGGGLGGTASLAMDQSAAGTAGGVGDAAAVDGTVNSSVVVRGDSAYALFGQSATGNGNSGNVSLEARDSLLAQGADSIAVYGESTARGSKGDIKIDLGGAFTVGGSGTGSAAMLVGGRNNVLTNHSLLFASGVVMSTNDVLASRFGDFSALAITGTSGNDQIENQRTATTLGRIIGNVDLGGGTNGFHNHELSSVIGLGALDLGGGLFVNDGLMSNRGIGTVASVAVTGGFTQSLTGDLVTDIDLDNQTTDRLALTANGQFAGEAPLNFVSIDKLFEAYTLATGAAMVNAGLMPTTLHPTVGFDFKTRVDNGTDLVLYADKPTFLSLAKDPASGTKDPGVYQMASYLDAVEAAKSPDNPLARLLNMLRFLPNEKELGDALTRLTPHYAVHSFEMVNRSADTVQQMARACTEMPSALAPDGKPCVWFDATPNMTYTRDTGSGTTMRDDKDESYSLGAVYDIDENWGFGLGGGWTDFKSRISYGGETLSDTAGDAWQAYAIAKYKRDRFFADLLVGGGTGNFSGERDTSLAQVGYIPGETLGGVYLPEMLHDGIGNSVTYDQDTKLFGASLRLGYTQPIDIAYLRPTLQFDARWLEASGEESGSIAAFTFDGSSNSYFAATPGLEIGVDIPMSETVALRLTANGEVSFSNTDWEIEGQFKAAKGLGAAPLTLTQSVDSPLYRVGAGVDLLTQAGFSIGVRYDGVFGDTVEANSVSGGLKINF
ncbi:outer membrane autotransporter barrel domain-containing protein [Aurantimonas sp. 22II-16-19i]|nr:outer membrane autotransporter barrel domain-containing protein [Aurantimonas sp. 22II-16-19i]